MLSDCTNNKGFMRALDHKNNHLRGVFDKYLPGAQLLLKEVNLFVGKKPVIIILKRRGLLFL